MQPDSLDETEVLVVALLHDGVFAPLVGGHVRRKPFEGVGGTGPRFGSRGDDPQRLDHAVEFRQKRGMLGDDRSHGGRKAGNPRHRLLEKSALLLLREMIAEMIPQHVERFQDESPAFGSRRAGRGECRLDGVHQIEKIAMFGEHVPENHRVGAVDRSHGKNLREKESIQARLCLEKGMLEET